jgi:hypothetical protein
MKSGNNLCNANGTALGVLVGNGCVLLKHYHQWRIIVKQKTYFSYMHDLFSVKVSVSDFVLTIL